MITGGPNSSWVNYLYASNFNCSSSSWQQCAVRHSWPAKRSVGRSTERPSFAAENPFAFVWKQDDNDAWLPLRYRDPSRPFENPSSSYTFRRLKTVFKIFTSHGIWIGYFLKSSYFSLITRINNLTPRRLKQIFPRQLHRLREFFTLAATVGINAPPPHLQSNGAKGFRNPVLTYSKHRPTCLHILAYRPDNVLWSAPDRYFKRRDTPRKNGKHNSFVLGRCGIQITARR